VASNQTILSSLLVGGFKHGWIIFHNIYIYGMSFFAIDELHDFSRWQQNHQATKNTR
jgi:hypothetical protein